jgi:hypothetical protein
MFRTLVARRVSLERNAAVLELAVGWVHAAKTIADKSKTLDMKEQRLHASK